ncbi:hypothetical protein ACFL1M_00385 [Patescibacteria group bacterium]
MSKKKKLGWMLFFGLIIIDMAFLSWWALAGKGHELNVRMGMVEKRLDTLIKREGYDSELGDEVLVNKAAAEAVKSLKPELEARNTTPEPSPIEDVLGAQDGIREYFVPMGSGSTSKREWADVSSAQATVNSDRYGEIVSVYFEASIKSINGKVEARILDRTSSEVIHNSNISSDSTSFEWKFSKPFELGKGGKTYMVQMKSSTGELAEMNQARLRILARD